MPRVGDTVPLFAHTPLSCLRRFCTKCTIGRNLQEHGQKRQATQQYSVHLLPTERKPFQGASRRHCWLARSTLDSVNAKQLVLLTMIALTGSGGATVFRTRARLACSKWSPDAARQQNCLINEWTLLYNDAPPDGAIPHGVLYSVLCVTNNSGGPVVSCLNQVRGRPEFSRRMRRRRYAHERCSLHKR